VFLEFAQIAKQAPGRLRWLVCRLFPAGLSCQTAQVLAVGLREMR
jgi:hypothetical protein